MLRDKRATYQGARRSGVYSNRKCFKTEPWPIFGQPALALLAEGKPTPYTITVAALQRLL
jgi:hypothetical protein